MSSDQAAPGRPDEGEFGASFPAIDEERIAATAATGQQPSTVAEPAAAESGPASETTKAEEAEADPAPAEELDRPARPVWFGALMTGCFLTGVGWLLAYTVLDWDWQQAIGGWNYLIALAFLIAQGQLMEHWRGHPRHR